MTVTTEIRRDPISGRSVVIDHAPFKRRDDFALEVVRLEDPPAAYPILPPALAEKVQGVTRHLDATGRCIFCDVIAEELSDRRRIICDQEEILAIAPFASRVPFETWLMPRAHEPRFEETADRTLEDLAVAIRSVLSGIDWALERPAYNLVLHSAPLTGAVDRAFHWHVEILPRVTRFSGLEWGSGMYRNPVAPEDAAKLLRNHPNQV